VSAGSLWEITIKLSLGKLGMSVPFEEAFPAQLDANEIRILPGSTRRSRRGKGSR
jgi:PIN domain nuclease of toxin-antitoxin system